MARTMTSGGRGVEAARGSGHIAGRARTLRARNRQMLQNFTISVANDIQRRGAVIPRCVPRSYREDDMELAFAAMMGACGTLWPGWWRGPHPHPDPEPWWRIVEMVI